MATRVETGRSTMRVLIVDDEPLEQAALGKFLAARSDVEFVDFANDSVKALKKLGNGPYDLLLLDINMPELSSTELLNRLKGRVEPLPAMVLVTAHDEHAVAAFERHAVDYVLKPVSEERIGDALAVAVRRTPAERASHWAEVLPQLQASARSRAPKIAIKNGSGRFVFIDLREVSAVQAEGNYVLLHRMSGAHLLREPISAIAEKLRAYGFIRIHRSVLVNASLVEEIEVRPSGDYGLRIRGGREYTVTRTYKKNLKSLAELRFGTDAFITG
jgi:two-component system LytT family response regulator